MCVCTQYQSCSADTGRRQSRLLNLSRFARRSRTRVTRRPPGLRGSAVTWLWLLLSLWARSHLASVTRMYIMLVHNTCSCVCLSHFVPATAGGEIAEQRVHVLPHIAPPPSFPALPRAESRLPRQLVFATGRAGRLRKASGPPRRAAGVDAGKSGLASRYVFGWQRSGEVCVFAGNSLCSKNASLIAGDVFAATASSAAAGFQLLTAEDPRPAPRWCSELPAPRGRLALGRRANRAGVTSCASASPKAAGDPAAGKRCNPER